MLNKNPTNQINIFDVLNDDWCNQIDSNHMIWINGEYINFYTALLNDNDCYYAINIQQNKLNNNKICSSEYMSQSPMNSTELLKDSTPYIIENNTKVQENEEMPTDNNNMKSLELDLNNL